MTLFDMIQQGDVFHLIGMGVLFVLMVLMINAIGSGKSPAKTVPQAQPVQKSGNAGEVTAAITAAVNEYRKNN